MDQPSTAFPDDGHNDTSSMPLVACIDFTADHPITPAELDALERLLGADLATFLNP